MSPANATLVRIPCPLCDSEDSVFARVLDGFRVERCKRCGFVFVNPQYGAAELITQYESRPEDEFILMYERLAKTSAYDDYKRILGEIEAFLPQRGRLLDFGCAAGYFFELASRRGWDAHGVDVGPWTRKAAAARQLENLHVGLLKDLSFPTGHFDVVYSNQVVEHLQKPKDDLAEIRRILRPGGLIYLNVPNYQCLSILLGRDQFEMNKPMGHLNYFTPRTLRALLEASKFHVIRTSTYGGVKWENILGRRIKSDQLSAYELSNVEASDDTTSTTCGVRSDSRLQQIVSKFARRLVYRWAQVGMSLEAIAIRE